MKRISGLAIVALASIMFAAAAPFVVFIALAYGDWVIVVFVLTYITSMITGIIVSTRD